MITLYTTPSCSSCRKAKKWLNEHQLEYEEKNLFDHRITEDDIDRMLKNAENGFDDIISTRSKIFKELNVDIDEMKVSELKKFILEHPSILKRPIIILNDKMQVGYNDEDIRIFVPTRLRELFMREDCTAENDCDYQTLLAQYLSEINQDKTKKKH